MTQDIGVSLGSEIIYVAGTVNGEPSTWVLGSPNTWKTTVEPSPNNLYEIGLTAYDALGHTATYNFTLNYGIQELITDRTQADVDLWRMLSKLKRSAMTPAQKEIWSFPMKGNYNLTDLNRVGEAVQYLADQLHYRGYHADVLPKTDWTMTDLVMPENVTRYLDDISTLRSALNIGNDVPDVPGDMHKLTFEEANDIERILEIVEYALRRMSLAWFYSGDLFSGEV